MTRRIEHVTSNKFEATFKSLLIHMFLFLDYYWINLMSTRVRKPSCYIAYSLRHLKRNWMKWMKWLQTWKRREAEKSRDIIAKLSKKFVCNATVSD